MLAVAYYSSESGEVSRVLRGVDLNLFPQASASELAIFVGADAHLPGYIEAGEFRPMPEKPTPDHVFDWSAKAWVLPLVGARAAKWREVKAARDAREFGPFEWNGNVFDGDADAQRRLQVALDGAKEALETGEPFATPWKLADNSVIMLLAQDVVDVYRAFALHNIKENHEQAMQKWTQIQAAQSIEELESIQP